MLDKSVFIPPLNLTPKSNAKPILDRIFSHKNLDQNAKNLVDSLKQNTQFIREKSLYRYYISKNRGADSHEKRPLIPKELEASVKVDQPKMKLARILSTNDIKSQQINWQRPQNEPEPNKQKYFKRKNRMNRTQLCPNKHKVEQNTMDNEQERSQKSLIELLKESEIPMMKSSSTLSFQEIGVKQALVVELRQQNQLISQQNTELRRKLVKKDQKIQELTANVLALQAQNLELQKQIQIINNRLKSNAAKQTELINQLQLKERTIKKLENGYRYMQIQNTVLNNAKVQCSAQINVIGNLERQKRVLQEKVKLLYQLGKKKKGITKSPMRDQSDVSLSLSVQKEDKLDDVPLPDSVSRKHSRKQCSQRTYSCVNSQ